MTGMIKQRMFPAKIIIYPPIDHAIRKAVVIPVAGLPHNHPSFPNYKPTFQAKKRWAEAVHAAGIMGATVGKVENGVHFFPDKSLYQYDKLSCLSALPQP